MSPAGGAAEPVTHLEVRLLQDAGELGGAVVLDLEAADVAQDLRHQLHVVVLHRLQLHLLLLLVSLRRGSGGGRAFSVGPRPLSHN